MLAKSWWSQTSAENLWFICFHICFWKIFSNGTTLLPRIQVSFLFVRRHLGFPTWELWDHTQEVRNADKAGTRIPTCFLNTKACISFLYWATNYHKFRGLKQQTLLSHYSCLSKSRVWLNWVLCCNAVRGLLGLKSHKRLDWEKIYFQMYSDCWQNSFLCSYRSHSSLLLWSQKSPFLFC